MLKFSYCYKRHAISAISYNNIQHIIYATHSWQLLLQKQMGNRWQSHATTTTGCHQLESSSQHDVARNFSEKHTRNHQSCNTGDTLAVFLWKLPSRIWTYGKSPCQNIIKLSNYFWAMFSKMFHSKLLNYQRVLWGCISVSKWSITHIQSNITGDISTHVYIYIAGQHSCLISPRYSRLACTRPRWRRYRRKAQWTSNPHSLKLACFVICLYIYMCVCVYIYTYIYMYYVWYRHKKPHTKGSRNS